MPRRRLSIITAVFAGLLLVGCSDAGVSRKLTQVKQAGTYGLFATAAAKSPVAAYPLQKGDKIGFEFKENKKVRAVAGPVVVSLPKNSSAYFWKRVDMNARHSTPPAGGS
jgi:hypothetical protein